MYSGKLNRGKGLECLLRAWALHREQNGPGRLVLVGGGAGHHLSCEEELRAFVTDKKLDSTVTFAGYQPDVETYLKAADAFLFPSENEALGLALLEAMACGLPVLSAAAGGMLDIVEDERNGGLIPVGDDQAWRRGMGRMVAEHAVLRKTWGAAARETAINKFGFAQSAAKHLELMRELIQKRGA